MIESDGSPVENAVVSRLARNWHRRASVRKAPVDLDEYYEAGRPDFPLALTPMARHPQVSDIDAGALDKALFLGALAFHRHTIVIEQLIVGPTFSTVLERTYPGVGGPDCESAILQASVDEQYHSLMHLRAAQTMRRNRSWTFSERDLPQPALVRRFEQRRDDCTASWQRDLVSLAFTTIIEISIDAYLVLVGRDNDIQPVNRATAALHWRDEKCHASISEEIAEAVFVQLNREQQDFFMQEMQVAAGILFEQDLSTWRKIVDLAGIRSGQRLIDECAEIPGAKRLIRDNSGVHRLWTRLDALSGSRYKHLLAGITAAPSPV